MLPEDLLMMFQQNQGELNKFNVPILTPSVVSNIYSKTSTYAFPETDQNNRINMLNDPLFIKLEKSTFKNLHQLNDDDFCSAVWAYSRNHEEEQGILNTNISDRVGDAVVEELSFRQYNLSEENLGLVLRGLAKLPVMRDHEKEWGEVINFLG